MPSAASPGPSATDFSFESIQVAPGVHLHLNRCTTRKTHRLCLFWVGNLERAGITSRAMLPGVLMRGTQALPGMQQVTQHLEGLYGVGMAADIQKVGERHLITFRSEFVSDSYLPGNENVLGQVVSFISDVISDPFLVDGQFPSEMLEQEKSNHQRYLRSLIDEKRSYAFEHCLRHVCSEEAHRFYEYGYEEDLSAIDSAALLSTLKDARANSEVHLYFSGDISTAEAREALAPLLALHKVNSNFELHSMPDLKVAGDVKIIDEELDLTQAQLFLAYRTQTRFGDPGITALAMMNGILGSFSHSKLFLNVREAANLCYSVGSELNRSQGLMFMSAGIEPDKYEQARDLMQQQLQQIQDGDVSDQELDATRRAMANRIEMIEDSPATLMEIDLNYRLSGGRYVHTQYAEEMNAVTKDEIIVAARKLSLDTVYFLKPKAGA